MATTKKTATTTRKSTPAGRKTRSSTRSSPRSKAPVSTAKSEPVAAPVAEAPQTETAQAAPSPTAEAGSDVAPFRRPDLIQAVADRSALKRSDAKLVLELVLEELGKALDAGDELVLQPLGKLSVKKRKSLASGELLTVKLKRNAAAQQAARETPLADPVTDS